MQPVDSGWSSGTVALPGRDFTIGLASRSATASSSSRAPWAPTPTSTARRDPWLRAAAARRRSAGGGTPGEGRNTGAVAGTVAGVLATQ